MEKPYAEVCLQVGTRRVACHHCGNVRKDFLQCSDCPQVFCRNCAEKVAAEHGREVFSQGCPVCKKLCCCAAKSVACSHQTHCYRKCPASKARVASGGNNNRNMSNNNSANCGTSLDLLVAACKKANVTQQKNNNHHQKEVQQSKRSYFMLEQNEVMSELSCSTSSSSSSEKGLSSTSSNKKPKRQDGSAASAVMMMQPAVMMQPVGKSLSAFESRSQVEVAETVATAPLPSVADAASLSMPMSMSWIYMPVQVPLSMTMSSHGGGMMSPAPHPVMMYMSRLQSSSVSPYYFTSNDGHAGQERHLQYHQAKLLQAQQAYSLPAQVPALQQQQQQKYPDWLLRPSYPIGSLKIQRAEEVNVGSISADF